MSDKPKKATAAVVALRVNEVLRLRLDCAQFHDIRDYADAPERAWGVSDSQLKRYIEKADKLLVLRHKDTRRKAIARGMARLETLYARCVNAADFSNCVRILAEINKLRGLYPQPKEEKGKGDTFNITVRGPDSPPPPADPPAEGVPGG